MYDALPRLLAAASENAALREREGRVDAALQGAQNALAAAITHYRREHAPLAGECDCAAHAEALCVLDDIRLEFVGLEVERDALRAARREGGTE